MTIVEKPQDFAVIVLAAGQSSRLGQPKQLIDIQGQSLLQRQCQLALALTPNVYCVVGYQADVMHQEISNLPVKIIINQHWQQGMSTSIAVGVQALAKNIQGVMILLVDQWQLTLKELNDCMSTWNNNPERIVVAQKNSLEQKNSVAKKSDLTPNCGANETEVKKLQMGPPSIFPKVLFSTLAGLKGDSGAKSVLLKHRHLIHAVSIPSAFVDLDTPAHLEIMQKEFATLRP